MMSGLIRIYRVCLLVFDFSTLYSIYIESFSKFADMILSSAFLAFMACNIKQNFIFICIAFFPIFQVSVSSSEIQDYAFLNSLYCYIINIVPDKSQ